MVSITVMTAAMSPLKFVTIAPGQAIGFAKMVSTVLKRATSVMETMIVKMEVMKIRQNVKIAHSMGGTDALLKVLTYALRTI